MNPVNATPQGVQKAPKGKLYNWANKFFKAPTNAERWAQNGMPGNDAFMATARQKTRGFVGRSMKGLLDYDYRGFPVLSVGKRAISLAEPPKGALLLLLYPGTVIPRLYRAYQRGKQNNDYREMGDVLRRDMTAITLFVFALGPIVKGLSAFTEKMSGVKLLDPNTNQVLKYSQFKNYEIDSPGALKAILTEGNGRALVKAVSKLHDRGLSKFDKNNKLAPKIEEIKESTKKLVEAFEGNKNSWSENLDGLAKTAHDHIEDAEKLREKALKKAENGGSADMIKAAQKLQGEFKGVLQNSAKVHRLPSDIVSFAILVGAIGYLPMWINTQWNARQFEKKMAAKQAAEKNNQPATTQQPAPAPVTLQGPAFDTVSPWAGTGFAGQATTQPFGVTNRQLPPNPFNRLG